MSEYTKVEMRLGLMCRPDLNSSTRCIIPYINGLESSSLYTCNTNWRSVYYMILSKPLVRLTTAHYQSTVSMISFAQVLTVQWSNTIPCRNVRFPVGITSHDIPFQQEHQGSKARNIIQYVQLQVNKLGKKTVGPLTVPYNNEYNF